MNCEILQVLNAEEDEIVEVINLMKQLTPEGRKEIRRMAILQNAIQRCSEADSDKKVG